MLPACLLPTLIEKVCVERPDLRQCQLLVPPDVPVRTGFHQVLSSFRLLGIDQHNAVIAFLHRVAALGEARSVVAVIAHGRNVSDVDHRLLPALLLQDVYPLVPVPGHGRRIARPIIADVFVHGRKRAQLAVRALGDVDDHVPLLHLILTSPARAAPP